VNKGQRAPTEFHTKKTRLFHNSRVNVA